MEKRGDLALQSFAAGSVIGMQYREADYAADEWEDINKGYWYLGVSSFFGPLISSYLVNVNIGGIN